MDCGYSLEPPRQGDSNIRNIQISVFLSENFQLLVVKFSIYLNKHVFVMLLATSCQVSKTLFPKKKKKKKKNKIK